MLTPFYDPNKTFEENLEKGPYGAFADGEVFSARGGPASGWEGPPKYEFLGRKVNSLFGIPAGPLISSQFCKGAFDKGFDICTYKTIRSAPFPCHPWPNVLALHVDGDLTLEKAKEKLIADTEFREPISITNSFGVPILKATRLWQEDVKRAIVYAKTGQVLVLGFMGTVRPGQTVEEFVEDNALAARQALETGVKILEINLSCPNIGNEGLICYDLEMTEKICERVRKEIGTTPLILKVGYYQSYEDARGLAEIAKKYADAISAINTIPATVVNADGLQALPGKNRGKAGVCGASIKWAGLEMVKKFKKAREEVRGNFKIIGVGGVMNANDYMEYMSAGADAVMSATGAMWNPYLAKEVKEKLG